MMPPSRTPNGGRFNEVDTALEAWSIAMRQLFETGKKAVRSGGFLAEISNEDVQIAEAEYETVFEVDKVRLFHYLPTEKTNSKIPPVVICYGLFGRQTMIDLQEDRSLVRNLLAAGIDVYVVDWGNPTRADQFLNFDDYVDYYLGSCMEHVVAANGGKPVNMFGICEGGTFAVMLAAMRPELFAGLAIAITPVDFHGDSENFWLGEGFLNSWINNLDENDIDLLVETYGMLPGAMTGAIFAALTPINSMTKYNLGIANLDGDKDAMLNFLRMEKWIADRPDHPAELARQWLNGLYRENKLVKGEFVISGKPVNLKKISCPVLNIYALQDHIIPISCSKALGDFLKPSQYEEIGFPGGHVGVFVSRKAQGVVAGGLIEWLQKDHAKTGTKSTPKRKSSKTNGKK
ncbi:MAG: alpha/beta fold hydrolase [Pseudomonadota bacterium]